MIRSQESEGRQGMGVHQMVRKFRKAEKLFYSTTVSRIRGVILNVVHPFVYLSVPPSAPPPHHVVHFSPLCTLEKKISAALETIFNQINAEL